MSGRAPHGASGHTASTVVLERAAFGYGGVAAVTGVTATLNAGEAVALIGPNGSGKSTLIGGLLGLVEQLDGSARILGTEPSLARTRVGLLPQSDARDATLPISVQQVVTMGLYRSLGAFTPVGSRGRARVRAALEQVRLEHRAQDRFGSLSGGQQQRVILARALVAEPALILLDEPFNGLDRPNRESLLDTIRDLRQRGTTLVISTHDLEIAQEVCSHAMLLDRRMVTFGTLDEALTVEHLSDAFHDTSVAIHDSSVITRHEIDHRSAHGPDAGHLHHEHTDTWSECANDRS